MKSIKIPKKTKGEFRTIYIPSRRQKIVLRGLLGNLKNKCRKYCDENIVHGFTSRKSPVTNAKRHVGYNFTLSFDLENFFESVNEKRLRNKLSLVELKQVLIDGHAGQGLPTSPVIANIAASELDGLIAKNITEKYDIVYSRYADDLAFSYNTYEFTLLLKKEIPRLVGMSGFSIKKSKTRLQDSRFGLRNITGINVGDDKLSCSKTVKRRLRAATHQGNVNVARGLSEWSKLKEPKQISDFEAVNEEQLQSMLYSAGFPAKDYPKLKDLPKKNTDKINESFYITGDLAYMIGASTFTSNWRSCLNLYSGSNKHKAPFLPICKEVRVAVLLGTKTCEHFGVIRREMRARVFIFEFADGTKYFGRSYGESESKVKELEKILLDLGYIKFGNYKQKLLSVVNVKFDADKFGPYTDCLAVKISKLSVDLSEVRVSMYE